MGDEAKVRDLVDAPRKRRKLAVLLAVPLLG